MKKTLLSLSLFIVSFIGFSQQKLPSLATSTDNNPSRIMFQAKELLKKDKNEKQEFSIEEWEAVLKKIGEVTKTENVLFCQKSKENYATLTFEDGKLISVCETFQTKENASDNNKVKHRK